MSHHEQIVTYVAVDGRRGSLPEVPHSLLLRDPGRRAQHPAVPHRPPGASIAPHGTFTLHLQPGFRQVQGKCH